MALLSVEQAAKRLNRTDRTIRRWIIEGTLQATHPTHGRKDKYLVEESEVERLAGELAQEQQVKPSPGPGPAMDIAKRLDYLQGWLGDLQRWYEELEQRIERVEQGLGSVEPKPASKPAQKRATVTPGTLETPGDIPPGSKHAREFAEDHGVNERTFRDHIDKLHVAAIKRPKTNRPHEIDRWLTFEQQQQAIDYWLEIGTPFNTRPDLYPTLNYDIPEMSGHDQETEQETKTDVLE